MVELSAVRSAEATHEVRRLELSGRWQRSQQDGAARMRYARIQAPLAEPVRWAIIAHAMGTHVVLFTTSADKVADAKRLGADEVVLSGNQEAVDEHAGTFHFILDTVSANHDLDVYLNLLKRDGTLTLVGLPPEPVPLDAFPLIRYRRSLAGSLIGGIPETQEMLDYCAEHGFACDIELIRMDQINEAYERMLKSDVKYRFVIDMATLG